MTILLQKLYEWIQAERCAKSQFNSVPKSPLPPKRPSQQTYAEVFISGFGSVRIGSSALHSNMDVEETAYSIPSNLKKHNWEFTKMIVNIGLQIRHCLRHFYLKNVGGSLCNCAIGPAATAQNSLCQEDTSHHCCIIFQDMIFCFHFTMKRVTGLRCLSIFNSTAGPEVHSTSYKISIGGLSPG